MDLKVILRSLPLSIIALLLVVGVLYATTTIGTNISTGGTLTVTGVSTLTGGVVSGANMTVPAGNGLDVATAGVLGIGTSTATTIHIGKVTGAVGVNITSGTGGINFTGESVFDNTSNVSFGAQTQTITEDTTLTPTSTYMVLTCNAAPGTITLSETGARTGQLLVVTAADGSGGATCLFSDSANVQYVVGANVALDDFDSIIFIYDGSEWIQIAASNN